MFGKMAIFVCIAFVAISSIQFASAAAGVFLPNPNAAPGTCLIEDGAENFIMKHGEEASLPNRCMRAICGGDGSVSFSSCGKIGTIPPNCMLEADLTKPYPDCCEQVKCEKV